MKKYLGWNILKTSHFYLKKFATVPTNIFLHLSL